MEYRPFPDERADEFGAFMRYAFSPAAGPYDPEEADDHDTIAERRGLFDAVDDPLVPRNDATFRVAVADGSVAVEPVGRGEGDGLSDAGDANATDPDAAGDSVDPAVAAAEVDVGALSQLYVGYRSVDEIVRAGRLGGPGDRPLDGDAAASLRALFPPRTTHLREGF